MFWDAVDEGSFDDNIDEIVSANLRLSQSNLHTRKEDIYYPAFDSDIGFWED